MIDIHDSPRVHSLPSQVLSRLSTINAILDKREEEEKKRAAASVGGAGVDGEAAGGKPKYALTGGASLSPTGLGGSSSWGLSLGDDTDPWFATASDYSSRTRRDRGGDAGNPMLTLIHAMLTLIHAMLTLIHPMLTPIHPNLTLIHPKLTLIPAMATPVRDPRRWWVGQS